MNAIPSGPAGWNPYDVWCKRVFTAEVRIKFLELMATPDPARRVTEPQPITIDVSFEDAGELLGSEGGNIGTYASSPRPDGSLAAWSSQRPRGPSRA